MGQSAPTELDRSRLCRKIREAYSSVAIMDRISVNSQIHFGKPCLVGTRITVQNVLELLNDGLSFETIIQDYYPDLQVEDIRACLRYAIALVAAEDIRLVSA
ncbi:MAG: DUF433 domain-containing protein [Microcystaceae cyanobacterium]